MPDRLWILGQSSPEMDAIEALLRECGERTVSSKEAGPGKAVGGYDSHLTAYMVGLAHPVLFCCDNSYGIVSDAAAEFPNTLMGQVISELARLGMLPSTWRGGYGGYNSAVGDMFYDRPDWAGRDGGWRCIVTAHSATHRNARTLGYYSCGWAVEIPGIYVRAAMGEEARA